MKIAKARRLRNAPLIGNGKQTTAERVTILQVDRWSAEICIHKGLKFSNADLIQPPEHPLSFTMSHPSSNLQLSYPVRLDFKCHLPATPQKITPTLDPFSLPRCVHRAPWRKTCATAVSTAEWKIRVSGCPAALSSRLVMAHRKMVENKMSEHAGSPTTAIWICKQANWKWLPAQVMTSKSCKRKTSCRGCMSYDFGFHKFSEAMNASSRSLLCINNRRLDKLATTVMCSSQ